MRRSTYLATRSTSRFTGSPGPLIPRVVTVAVWGIRANSKVFVVDGDDREADAVDGDRALLHDVAEDRVVGGDHRPGRTVGQSSPVRRSPRPRRRGPGRCGRRAGRQPDGPFEVHPVAGDQGAEAGAAQRLLHRIGGPPALAHSTAVRQQPLTAIEAPEVGVVEDDGRLDLEARRPGALGDDRPHGAELLDEAGEHQSVSWVNGLPVEAGVRADQLERPRAASGTASARVAGPGPAASGRPSAPSMAPPA